MMRLKTLIAICRVCSRSICRHSTLTRCSHRLQMISSLWCRTLSLCTQGTFDANDEIKPSNQKHILLQQLLPY
ncbi:hypothetical protein DPMN_003177 [Dreissena polymorpha]|uniref:Uncharacterized protein n=1 Tax=Dreissena polymorpha TaxID=45954 RepID=A0A9D4MNS3_DREPO|nr:hypothetical protein DPMN_003177 [Dreissena polymorpha]